MTNDHYVLQSSKHQGRRLADLTVEEIQEVWSCRPSAADFEALRYLQRQVRQHQRREFWKHIIPPFAPIGA